MHQWGRSFDAGHRPMPSFFEILAQQLRGCFAPGGHVHVREHTVDEQPHRTQKAEKTEFPCRPEVCKPRHSNVLKVTHGCSADPRGFKVGDENSCLPPKSGARSASTKALEGDGRIQARRTRARTLRRFKRTPSINLRNNERRTGCVNTSPERRTISLRMDVYASAMISG